MCPILFYKLLPNTKKMFDKKTLITVLVALVIFKVIDKMFLDGLTEKFVPSHFEDFDEE